VFAPVGDSSVPILSVYFGAALAAEQNATMRHPASKKELVFFKKLLLFCGFVFSTIG
jgi:hypothetical protein